MSDDVQARIAELKRQRGYFAAFGQSQKVKAVDQEIAQLREKRSTPPAAKSPRKPPAEVETAEADQSRTETAAVRSASRKRRSKPSD